MKIVWKVLTVLGVLGVAAAGVYLWMRERTKRAEELEEECCSWDDECDACDDACDDEVIDE